MSGHLAARPRAIGVLSKLSAQALGNNGRARDKKGKWGMWYLISNLPLGAERAAKEYGFRFDCKEGFRDLKWDLGFSESRVRQIDAWSRFFVLFVIALMALTALGMGLLVRGGAQAKELLRRVESRRRDRYE
jgi:hypothetical protein